MSIESEQDLEGLRRVGRVVALTLEATRAAVELGVTTADLDAVAAEVFARHGAHSAPADTYDFPGTICISVNDEAVHGIPRRRPLLPGDLVKLDVTAELDGYLADAAISVPVPPAAPQTIRVAAAARAALRAGLGVARAGRPVSAIGRAVEREVRERRLTVLRPLAGHGIGRRIHEEPSVPNYYDPWSRARLTEGLVITIEPIISAGRDALVEADDGWTIRTADGAVSAHAEHTIVITRDRPIVLTAA
jgi:methionyl aminopeptidase